MLKLVATIRFDEKLNECVGRCRILSAYYLSQVAFSPVPGVAGLCLNDVGQNKDLSYVPTKAPS